MGYLSAFRISASGMNVERARMEVSALNIANANSSRGADGALFRPLRVVSAAAGATTGTFASYLDKSLGGDSLGGATLVAIQEMNVPPRLVYEPGHPDADARGFVAYPGVNPVTEMVGLMATVRAYEANVVALNAAKTMALKALDIGRGQ